MLGQERRGQLDERPLAIDQGAQPCGVGLVQQPADRHVDHGGIGQAGVAVAIGQARRFRLEVQPLGAVRLERVELETFQDVQHEQRDHALAVGRALVHLEPAVGGPDRRDELARRGGEVVLVCSPPSLRR